MLSIFIIVHNILAFCIAIFFFSLLLFLCQFLPWKFLLRQFYITYMPVFVYFLAFLCHCSLSQHFDVFFICSLNGNIYIWQSLCCADLICSNVVIYEVGVNLGYNFFEGFIFIFSAKVLSLSLTTILLFLSLTKGRFFALANIATQVCGFREVCVADCYFFEPISLSFISF